MKVIIPEKRLEQIISKYLDEKFKDLEQFKGYSYDIVFRVRGEEYGILGWNKPNDLFVYVKVINDIFSFFPIEKTEIKNIIGRYVEDRFNLKVINIYERSRHDLYA